MAPNEDRTTMPTPKLSARAYHSREPRRASPGLAFQRVFSMTDDHAAHDLRWERQRLSPDLAEVEAPAEWPAGASLSFLRLRDRAAPAAGEIVSVRLEMDRLLAELRSAALQAGYFAFEEDADLFTEEVGTLLLSRRAMLGRPRWFMTSEPTKGPGWRWDASLGTLAEGSERPALEQADVWRLLSLDDPALAALLAGRDGAPSHETRLLLALPDDLLLAAETDADATGEEQDGSRSGASDLLACITEAVLQRGKMDFIFPETVRRSGPPGVPLAEFRGAFEEVVAGTATLDLLKFFTAEGRLDLDGLCHATGLLVTALEIGIDRRVYAGEHVATRAHNERRLSISLANIDDALTAGGVEVNSEEAQSIAACLGALVGGAGMWQSARIAETCPALYAALPPNRSRRADDRANTAAAMRFEHSSCPVFHENTDEVLGWLRSQRSAAYLIAAPAAAIGSVAEGSVIPIRTEDASSLQNAARAVPLAQQIPELIAAVRRVWDGALLQAERFGLRHLGVTGPGQGEMLWTQRREQAGDEIAAASLIPSLRTQVRLGAASQPFITASAPWCMEAPDGLSPEQLRDVVLDAWRCGLKAISVVPWRRSSEVQPTTETEEVAFEEVAIREPDIKKSMSLDEGRSVAAETSFAQAEAETRAADGTRAAGFGAETKAANAVPLQNVTLAEAEQSVMERGRAALVETQLHRISELEEQLKQIQAKARENGETYDAKEPPRAMRHRLPAERASVTHAFVIADHEGTITVGLYPNGSPGEIYLRMTKEGSAVAGLLDSFAMAVSLALQHGVPVRVLARQFAEMRFEPSGATENEQIPYALSIMDYLFRWIELRFLSGHQMDLFANLSPAPKPAQSDAVRVTGTVSGPKSRVVPNVSGIRSATDKS